MNRIILQLLSITTVVLLGGPVLGMPEAELSGDNYLDKPELIRKWSKDQMPIPVYLKPGEGVPGFKPSYMQLVKNSFEEWSTATGGKVKFRYVDDPKQAEINLSWTDDPSKLDQIEPLQGGSTNCFCGDFGIEGAKIVMLTKKPLEKTDLSENDMHSTLLHEIGHALGLPHSGSNKDIMFHGFDYKAEYPPVLSDRDRRTVATLYSDSVKNAYVPGEKSRQAFHDPGVKVDADPDNAAGAAAMNRGDYEKAISIFAKLHEDHPNNRTFQLNYAGVLSNAGLVAANKGSYDTAIGYLEKALKVDPNLDEAKQNLVIAIDGKADSFLTAGKPAAAEPFYKQALELSIPLSRKELLKMTIANYSIALTKLGRQPEAAQLKAKYASVMAP